MLTLSLCPAAPVGYQRGLLGPGDESYPTEADVYIQHADTVTLSALDTFVTDPSALMREVSA